MIWRNIIEIKGNKPRKNILNVFRIKKKAVNLASMLQRMLSDDMQPVDFI